MVVGTDSDDAPVVETRGLTCRFGRTIALEDVELELGHGDVHAVLGRNGAGKTTLLRTLGGLVHPTHGSVTVMGRRPDVTDPRFCRTFGYVPSGTRSLYLRISGLENLLFFARLQGLTRRGAREQAGRWLDAVGLAKAAHQRVGLYSQGMQRRLVLARALLDEPSLLLLDEVTHDLDPEGADRVRELVTAQADRGAAVVWATQRVDEIRTFARTVTVLRDGATAFQGTVADLIRDAHTRRFLVRLRNGHTPTPDTTTQMTEVLGGRAAIEPTPEPEHYVLLLRDGVVLGDAVGALSVAGFQLLTCREERSTVETALRRITTDGSHDG